MSVSDTTSVATVSAAHALQQRLACWGAARRSGSHAAGAQPRTTRAAALRSGSRSGVTTSLPAMVPPIAERGRGPADEDITSCTAGCSGQAVATPGEMGKAV